MKDNELWLKKIKERLDDYSEPLPAAGWERLEKALPSSPLIATGKRKQIVFRRWAMTAAAAVLVAVSSVSLWWLQSPAADDVRRSAEPTLAVIPDRLPESVTPGNRTEQSEPVIRRVLDQGGTSHRQPLVAQRLDTEKTTSNIDKELPGMDAETIAPEVNEERSVSDKTGDISQATDKESSASAETTRRVYRPSGKDKLQLPVEKKSATGSKGWAVGLSVGNTGGLASLGNAGGDIMANNVSTGPLFSDKMDLSSVSNGVLDIPTGEELVFEGGVPYLRKSARKVKNVEHKQPISFGVSVRKTLPKGFSVETGLTYTMLSSEVVFDSGSDKLNQKLHYVGIPVRANWNFVDKERLTMYVSAGGAIEKCVYGKIGSDKETVKPLQLSVMGAVGVQYNVSNRVGLYVEPGISYFFDDGSPVQTIRKENPTNFTLQAGVRLTY